MFWLKDSKTRELRRLQWSALVVGAAVMAVEMTASRLLAPHFGASIFVWTSLILTVLLALSIGYWLGGRLAAGRQEAAALGWLMVGAALLQSFGARISGLVADSLGNLVYGWQSASAALLVGSFLTAAFTLAVPMVALGAISPLIIKRWAALADVARAGSGYLLLSTVGGALGTLLPSLALVPLWGSQRTIGLFSLLLLVTGLLFFRSRQRWRLWPLVLLVIVLAAVGDLNRSAGVVAALESPYQHIQVIQLADGRRALQFNEGLGIQSISVEPGERTGLYYDYFGALPLLRPGWPADQKVAIIGLAGGTAAGTYAVLAPDIRPEIIGVEIDPAVVRVGRQYLGLDERPVQVTVEDGRTFLKHEDRRYQALIIDAYSTQLYIPPHLVSQEFFRLAKRRLAADGLLALNLNATSDETPLFRALTNTMASVFPYVAAVPQFGTWNWLVLAGNQPIGLAGIAYSLPEGYEDMRADLLAARTVAFDPGRPVFTDDWAPVEFLTETMVARQVLEERGTGQ